MQILYCLSYLDHEDWFTYYETLVVLLGQYGASFECGALFGKNLNLGIKGDYVSKIGVFGQFLGNSSLKVSSFLHDGRGQ